MPRITACVDEPRTVEVGLCICLWKISTMRVSSDSSHCPILKVERAFVIRRRVSSRMTVALAQAVQRKVSFSIDGNAIAREASMRSFIIGALVVAIGVLGYLHWDSEHNTLFKAPGVEIKKN
jgi:hypothetical protein